MPDTTSRAGTADVDVAIVGGGANGLYLACLLAHRGVSVAVLEQRTEVADRPRAFGIHPAALAALDAVGVGDAVRAEALTLDAGAFTTTAGRTVSVSFAPPARPGPVVLDQRIVERMLERRLATLAPGALRRGVVVRAVRDTGESVSVGVASGGPVVSRYVVLADGVNGELAESEFGPLRGVGPARWYAMAEADAEGGADTDAGAGASDRTARLLAARDGIVESFPVPGARRRWVVLRASDAPIAADEFRMLVRDRANAHVGRIHGPVAVFRAQSRARRRLSAGRVVLAGDGAVAVSPIGGQGLALGWSGARVLASSLVQSLERGTPQFGPYARAVRRLARRAQLRSAFFMVMGDPARGRDLARRLAAVVLGARVARPLARRLVVVDAPHLRRR